ncbi:endonuclease/exonuclease/phosphatase (EEP) superfamily protein YafD [Psychrobacter sp. PL15]|jgi:endonuclease/exonuclease/phosphatase (EEP) superfamily protein YafD|uniref:endonuclease/exonuclease/phosphatase family protein n=1 Tax=unclassified Psychrobacter TaxID=196806 RepID=UPI001AE39E19|nr:endonuclease/exonuclease/phosphatase family protein [Psychrobacter sp. PL15]MEC5210126.1 endonuclease/exonuclease/phosphatase (EEP) superfamily protein YafD [Psychrobacter sp. PL15]
MDSSLLYYGVQLLAGLIAFITIWGWLPLDNWWVRSVDFPRIQLLVLGIIAWFAMLLFWSQWQLGQWALFIILSMALAFQLRMVLPYTKLWKKEVQHAKKKPKGEANHLKIMVSNVLTPNNKMQDLVDLVEQKQPDILITLESDQKWQDALTQIEPDYPYTVKVPLDNLYGMHLYSKLELIDPEVKYLIIDDIPSIHTQLRLQSGRIIWLYCLHPMPPSPTEADKSTTRDAELLMVGRHIKEQSQTAILAGDLNDVAWSKTTRRFQRISGLLDPRIGRYFVNTFHVNYPLLRWALDHIFHSACFTVVAIERLPSVGSDHFPVLTTLQYEPEQTSKQQENAPTAQAEDIEETENKIKEGKKEGSKVSKDRAENQ